MKLIYTIILASFIGCQSSRQVLQVSAMPDYDQTVKDHILFFTFEISKSNSGEKVKLINSVAGSGRMKNFTVPVHQLYRIKVVRYFGDGQKPVETEHEHPLVRSVEVSEPGGSLMKMPLTSHAGTLTVRIQEDKALEMIELFSVGPGIESKSIYKLKIKP